MRASQVAGVYDRIEDRESAYEKLSQRVAETGAPGKADQGGKQQAGGGLLGTLGSILSGSTGPRGGRREGAVEAATRSAARAIGSEVGRQIIRGVLGSLLGGGRRR